MKRLIFAGLLFCSLITVPVQAQVWTHVGPKSTNNSSDNHFETSQMNNIIKSPYNDNHFFASGAFGGLWVSYNGCNNWTNINTNPNFFYGVSDICFVNASEILVANFLPGKVENGVHQDISSRISRYDYENSTWTNLAVLPNPGSLPYTINTVLVSPANSQVYFAATTIGLFRSANSGASWTEVAPYNFENIVIVPQTGGAYKYYASGSNTDGDYGTPRGDVMLMESANGITWTAVNVTIPIPPEYIYSHGMICIGPVSGNDHDLFMQVVATNVPANPMAHDIYNWSNGRIFIYKIAFVNGSPVLTSINPASGTYSSGGFPARMCIAYDPVNAGVYWGSALLYFKRISDPETLRMVKPGKHAGINGQVHDDMHDIKIYTIGGQPTLFVACDGGIVKSLLPNFGQDDPDSHIYFSAMNNNLDVCLVNGFSGAATNSNLYLIGGQDIVNTDIYNAATGKNDFTHQTWENDGGHIDKFNDQFMVLDRSSYINGSNDTSVSNDSKYYLSFDGGENLSHMKIYYSPLSAAPFQSNTQVLDQSWHSTQSFATHLYYQDPYRPGRIFFGKHNLGIYQYEAVTNNFARKVNLADLTPTWCEWSGGWAAVRGISFSPQTPNSMHFLLNGTDPGSSGNPPTYPTVIKYIGNNLDDCWDGHNMHADAQNNPQWANLMLNFWQNFSTLTGCSGCTNLAVADQYKVNFLEIETSPWNKNVIYVLVDIPNNPQVKILKYDGTSWSNYSNGLPVNETPFSMVMDLGSNDGIYLSTDRAVYYRHATNSAWIPFTDGNLPVLLKRQMEINYMDNTVRVGTFGRGIWKSPLKCPGSAQPVNNSSPIPANIYESDDILVSKNTLQTGGPTAFRGTTNVTLNPGFYAYGRTTENTYVLAYIHGCTTPGTSAGWRAQEAPVSDVEKNEPAEMDFNVYPNPGEGEFTLNFREQEGGRIDVYSVYGTLICSINTSEERQTYTVDLTKQPAGVYLVTFTASSGEKITKRIIRN